MGGGTANYMKSDDGKNQKSCLLKKTGPNYEVRALRPSEKRTPSKKIVAAYIDRKDVSGSSDRSMTQPSMASVVADDAGKTVSDYLGDSFIVCEHLAETMDLATIKKITKQFGVDLDSPCLDPEVEKKELKKRIKAWKRCPNRIDLRHVCRDPVTGETCPVVQSLMTPQPYDPNILSLSTRLPPGTIGVTPHQVAFHGGANQSPLNQQAKTNDPHSLELGRRSDGTMCITIQYSPEARPPPEYFCSTERDVQAVDFKDAVARKSKSKRNSIKGGKNKKKKK